ncbi:hypothetical protein [Zavarzinella formosa]|uniref:hypothetical protein n=1 Tax=Zavarzinella formosa TaxID=360055 RepID=UPI00030491A4|nr:hypothetical protein [Zavarzinella formosa]
MRFSRVFVLFPLAFLMFAGCGEPALYPVKGRVMFQGKPMAGGGSISFMPVGDQPGKTAGGEIAPDGTFEMMTNKPGDGSMAGEFRVVIHQVVEQEPEASRDGEKVSHKSRMTVPPEDRIPPIYQDPQRSPLTITVEKKSPNQIDLELKRQ